MWTGHPNLSLTRVGCSRAGCHRCSWSGVRQRWHRGYRLTLTPAMRDSAQILIRNADAAAAAIAGRDAGASGPRVAALVRLGLVRAVARRELLAGYEIVPGDGEADGLAVVETWRGPRFGTCTTWLISRATYPYPRRAPGGSFRRRRGPKRAARPAESCSAYARPCRATRPRREGRGRPRVARGERVV